MAFHVFRADGVTPVDATNPLECSYSVPGEVVFVCDGAYERTSQAVTLLAPAGVALPDGFEGSIDAGETWSTAPNIGVVSLVPVPVLIRPVVAVRYTVSGQSDVRATYGALEVIPDATVPTLSATFTLTGAAGTLTFAWGAASDDRGTVDHYEYQHAATSDFATPTTGTTSALGVVVSGLAAGTKYGRYRAFDAALNPSVWSATLSGTVTASGFNGYTHRKSVAIGASTGAGTNYPVKLLVGESSGATGSQFHLEGHAQSFGVDLRFYAADGTTPLSYWVESTTGTTPNRIATVWVKVAADLGSAATILCHYGKTSDTSGSSISGTFTMGDDFSAASFAADTLWAALGKTAVCTGTPSIAAGKLVITGSNTAASCSWAKSTAPAVPAGYALRFGANISAATGYSLQVGFSDQVAIPAENDIQNHDASVSFYFHSSSHIYVENNSAGGTQNDAGTFDTAAHVWEIQRNASASTRFLKDGTLLTGGNITTNVPTAAMYVHALGYKTGTATGTISIDWLVVRKYILTEPAFSSAGAEE